MALDQILIMANIVEGGIIGRQAVSLTEFASNLEPEIAQGSILEIGGALYEAAADEPIAGWAGIAADSDVFIKLTVAGANATASFTVVAPAWDGGKAGWYSGAERYIGGLYKDAAGDYELKWLYTPLLSEEMLLRGATRPLLRKVLEIGDWDMDATETVAVPHGIQISKIRSIAAVIRTDSGNAIHPVAPSGHTLTFTGDQAWITLANALDVQLGRKTGGDYDNAIFDLTPYNRGWVTVEYEA